MIRCLYLASAGSSSRVLSSSARGYYVACDIYKSNCGPDFLFLNISDHQNRSEGWLWEDRWELGKQLLRGFSQARSQLQLPRQSGHVVEDQCDYGVVVNVS